MKDATLVFELTDAYEVWFVQIPDDATIENIDFEDIDFICMEEAGNTGMKVVEINVA